MAASRVFSMHARPRTCAVLYLYECLDKVGREKGAAMTCSASDAYRSGPTAIGTLNYRDCVLDQHPAVYGERTGALVQSK